MEIPTHRLDGNNCALTNVLMSGFPATACDSSNNTGGSASSKTTPSFRSSSTDRLGGKRDVKKVSSILTNLAGNATGSSVLVGDGVLRLALCGCRSTDKEMESRIESIDSRPVWFVMSVLSLSKVDDDDGGLWRDEDGEEREGTCDQMGKSSEENGMERRIWIVLVSGGPRSSNEIEWNIERTGARMLYSDQHSGSGMEGA